MTNKQRQETIEEAEIAIQAIEIAESLQRARLDAKACIDAGWRSILKDGCHIMVKGDQSEEIPSMIWHQMDKTFNRKA